MNKIVAFIPARGGSKGLPNKNIKEFAGKPLIAHSIEYALHSNLIDSVVVSTDDKNISQISKTFAAHVINRPSKFATDTATTESVINHYLASLSNKPEIIILLQPTSPLRPKDSLDKAIKKYKEGNYDTLLSISPTHRFFWKIKENGVPFPEYDYTNRPRRQDIVRKNINFVENGSLYIFSTKHFLKTNNRLGGKIGYVEWPEEYSVEIDSLLDFQFLEKLFIQSND